MKKTLSILLAIMMMFSIFTMNAIPSFAAELDLKVSKISGSLDAPGTSEVYLITDANGNKIENFSAKYTIEKNLKLPLSFSGPKSTEDGTIFEVKILDTCSTEPIKLEGVVKVVSLENKNQSLVAFSADGTKTVKNSVTKVNGDISITTSSGSRLYDFSSSTGNLNVYFGEDAAIQLHGTETGSKCLAYNIDPNQNLKTKYSLTSKDSAFINFIGNPKFENNITIKFAVPVNSSEPKIYQLKEGSNNELEEVTNAKITSSGADEFISFETDRLAATYVITSKALDGVEAAAPVEKQPIQETPPADVTNPEGTTTPPAETPTVDDTEKSPQTGSSVPMYVAYMLAFTGALAVLLVTKKRH